MNLQPGQYWIPKSDEPVFILINRVESSDTQFDGQPPTLGMIYVTYLPDGWNTHFCYNENFSKVWEFAGGPQP